MYVIGSSHNCLSFSPSIFNHNQPLQQKEKEEKKKEKKMTVIVP